MQLSSHLLPRIFGILLIVAGVAYLTSSVTSMVLPQHQRIVSRIMMPLYFCEVPIIFWLLIKGANEPTRQAGPSDVS